MSRIVRICIITVSVAFAMVLLLRMPISESSLVSPVESFPKQTATITLAPVPSRAAEVQPVEKEVQDESTVDPIPAEEPEEIESLPVRGDRLQAIDESPPFMADVDIASVQANHSNRREVTKPLVMQSYVSLDQVTEAPQFDHRLLSSWIVYPPGAKRQGLEATVVLRLFITSDGTIEDILVEEDPGYGFAEAALTAFTDVVVTPAYIDGKAVAVTMLFPITFSLR